MNQKIEVTLDGNAEKAWKIKFTIQSNHTNELAVLNFHYCKWI